MTIIEFLQLVTSTGVLAQGYGVLRWALRIERRLMKLEIKGGYNEEEKNAATQG